MLANDDENWGPRPFSMLKCWETFPSYNNFVRDKFKSFQLEGWGCYVLKEKNEACKIGLKRMASVSYT